MKLNYKDKFTEYLNSRYATRTIDGILFALKVFIESETVSRIKNEKAVTLKDLIAYRLELIERELVARTINNYLMPVRQYFKFLHSNKYLIMNPAVNLDLLKEKRKPVETYTKEEMNIILDSIDRSNRNGKRTFAQLSILYGSGLRRSELVKLTLHDVLVRGAIKANAKEKERLVPLTKESVKALDAYLNDVRPVYLSKSGNRLEEALWVDKKGEPMTNNAFGKVLRKLSLATGFNVSPQKIRRTTATLLLPAGLLNVQTLLGHQQPNTLKYYLDIDLSDIKEIHTRTKLGE